ncbi:hypothetical protein KIN20_028502 [Parelaphostrongylus tenuis]|uniref:Uncharacterized protein n=1 Tax=Parelaphostrongylus tenuis TaxID=148309 RepID=A0AAD5WER5_PARTN|nr:hypothetical protein KIN20_028502 [Parelaphostrongylus tenuis]
MTEKSDDKFPSENGATLSKHECVQVALENQHYIKDLLDGPSASSGYLPPLILEKLHTNTVKSLETIVNLLSLAVVKKNMSKLANEDKKSPPDRLQGKSEDEGLVTKPGR